MATKTFVVLMLVLALVTTACIEQGHEGETRTQTATLVGDDGTEFEVEISYDGTIVHDEEASQLLASIVVIPVLDDDIPETSDFGVAIPAADAHFSALHDHGFAIDVEVSSTMDYRMSLLNGYEWAFIDPAHAAGYCPGM